MKKFILQSLKKKSTEYDDYTKQQIFNVDERGLYWRNVPARTCIPKEQESTPRFKAAKDVPTLLL